MTDPTTLHVGMVGYAFMGPPIRPCDPAYRAAILDLRCGRN